MGQWPFACLLIVEKFGLTKKKRSLNTKMSRFLHGCRCETSAHSCTVHGLIVIAIMTEAVVIEHSREITVDGRIHRQDWHHVPAQKKDGNIKISYAYADNE